MYVEKQDTAYREAWTTHMAEYFGIVDGVQAEGYVQKPGDVLLIEFKYVTHKNEEKVLVVSLDKQSAERLKYLLNERILPRE